MPARMPAAAAGTRRRVADQPARGARRRHRHPERPDRHRRDRAVRHEGQHRDAAEQRRGQPGPERGAGRASGGRSDHRRVEGRRRQPNGPVRMLILNGAPAAARRRGGAAACRSSGRAIAPRYTGGEPRGAVRCLIKRRRPRTTMIAEGQPLSWTADVLDDLLALFRGRAAPRRRRRRQAAGREPMAHQPGGARRHDRAWPPRPHPSAGPPLQRRAYEETDDWQPAPSYAPSPGHYAPPSRPQRRPCAVRPVCRERRAAARYAARQRRRPGRSWQHVSRRPSERNYLAAHAVEKSFGDRKVVKGASLYVRRGEAVGLLGPNGAGKTTIFYMITGLIAADRGHVELDGHDVTTSADVPAGAARHRLPAAGGLDLPRADRRGEHPRRARSGRARPRSAASAISTRCSRSSTSPRLRKSPSIALSGGERRRCEIARALASRPNYMLLDEPFAGIDPIAVGDIQAAGAASDQPRHRRADHRPQCPRDAGPHRPRLHHLFGRGADGGPHRRHRQQSGGAAALPRRGFPPLGWRIARPAARISGKSQPLAPVGCAAMRLK